MKGDNNGYELTELQRLFDIFFEVKMQIRKSESDLFHIKMLIHNHLCSIYDRMHLVTHYTLSVHEFKR